MIPQTGQHIKCMLKNNVVVEGILEDWFANGVKLKSLDGKRLVLITNPNDIMMITVFLEPDEEAEKIVKPEVPQTELGEKFQEVYEQPSGDPLRDKSLAELRGMMAEEERQMIANKLRSHHIGDTKKVKYGYPGFFKKPGA